MQICMERCIQLCLACLPNYMWYAGGALTRLVCACPYERNQRQQHEAYNMEDHYGFAMLCMELQLYAVHNMCVQGAAKPAESPCNQATPAHIQEGCLGHLTVREIAVFRGAGVCCLACLQLSSRS